MGSTDFCEAKTGLVPAQPTLSCAPIVVIKFGGTSVADVAGLNRAADHIARERRRGFGVAVVVSAMGGETDRLDGLVHELVHSVRDRALPDAAERDVVLACGEQVTAGLLALLLLARDIPARSFQGWQIMLKTDATYQDARLLELETKALGCFLETGGVAVLAGFQGVNADGRITTLGRGGSDLTAVSVAAALGAIRCDIYTDIDGVHTADPRIVATTRLRPHISYEEMLELASLGARVLQTRSVELAMLKHVPLRVCLSHADPDIMADNVGTLISDEDLTMERETVTGIAHTTDEAKITLTAVSDEPGVAAQIFVPLAEAGINVDMIVQNIARDGTTDITFTIPAADLPRANGVLESIGDILGAGAIISDTNVAKISAVGVGMRSRAGVAARMFSTLAAAGVNIQAISTSEIKLSVLIDAAYTELAVRVLHQAYQLDADNDQAE